MHIAGTARPATFNLIVRNARHLLSSLKQGPTEALAGLEIVAGGGFGWTHKTAFNRLVA